MFSEPHFINRRSGSIEVICGSMFSGKTEELIRRLRRAKIAHQRVCIFKPLRDDRYAHTRVTTHDNISIEAVPVEHSADIISRLGNAEVVGLDEAQFFDSKLPRVCQEMVDEGIRVIVAGLDMDYLGKPFGPMPELMAMADFVSKVHAVCAHCGSLAVHSYRISPEDDQVLLGSKDKYEPRCRNCYRMGNILDFSQP